MVHAGSERKIAYGEPMPGRKERVAQLEIEPLRADVAAACARLLDLDPIAVAPRVFLDHDGVGALRQHAAGENARRLAGADRPRKRPAGGDLADYSQMRRDTRHVVGAHGIAVHGRYIGRRLGA